MMIGKSRPNCLGCWSKNLAHIPYTVLLTITIAKCKNYIQDFGTQALLDALFYSWEGGNALLVPPVLLASRVLVFMHSCEAQSSFVVPYWPSAPFRPLFISRFSASIKDHIVFVGNSVLMHGNNHKSLLGSSSWTFS